MLAWLKVLTILLIFILSDCIDCLRLEKVNIPNYVIKNSTANLECVYNLEGDALYSVKWYKDGNEFFRYLPREHPPAQTYKLPGVEVDLENSSDAVVSIINVSSYSTGNFRCEVSGEAPEFQTVTEGADMIVVSIPTDGTPTISGSQSRYHMGEWVNANCSAGRSKPALSLKWLVNEMPVRTDALQRYDNTIDSMDGLETATLGLHFQVDPHHFRYGSMKLKCVASLYELYSRSNEESVEPERQVKTVLESHEAAFASNSRADPMQGTSLRENFATKILSFFIEPNASSKANAEASSILLSLLTLYIVYGYL